MSGRLPHAFLQIHPQDNVLVALQDLPQGKCISFNGHTFELPQDIPAKHKFSVQRLGLNEAVMMYGVLVGKTTQPILQGGLIHTHNLKHDAETYGLDKKQAYHWHAPDVSAWQQRTFMGYPRSDGRVGTRNYWLVIPLVFCENRNILVMKDALERELGFAQPDKYRHQVHQLLQAYHRGNSPALQTLEATAEAALPSYPNPIFPNVDGIKFLTHEMGCGGTNQDAQTLAAVFAGFCLNPNVAGITVLSLGCQKTSLEDLKQEIHLRNPRFDKPLLYFDQQQYGTEHALLSAAIRETFRGLIEINQQERRATPIAKLNIGLKCGGSDGFSGISANPALGYLSDVLTTLGAQTLLAEFPELCGVEQSLIDRCEQREDAEKFMLLMQEYAAQAAAVGAGFDMNPSKGNIRDGLITDAIKSAGAAKKGGNAPIAGVLNYTEQPQRTGLHLLCTPGNDVLATTGMAASGANVILFTTGLGTPTGNAITPTVKISTNTPLAQRMHDIIDFDAGAIISGDQTIAENGAALLEWVLELASGTRRTKAELLGQDDFIPWRRGVNL